MKKGYGGTRKGDILFEGQECRFRTISDSESRGIVIIHQELALSPFLSIAENIFLGNERQRGGRGGAHLHLAAPRAARRGWHR